MPHMKEIEMLYLFYIQLTMVTKTANIFQMHEIIISAISEFKIFKCVKENRAFKRGIFTKAVIMHRLNAYRSTAWFPSSAISQQ